MTIQSDLASIALPPTETCLKDIENIVPYYTQHPLDDWFLCNLLLAVVTAELGDSEHALSLLRTALQSEDNIQVTIALVKFSICKDSEHHQL